MISIWPQVIIQPKNESNLQPEIAEFLLGPWIMASNTLYMNLQSKKNDSNVSVDFYLVPVFTRDIVIKSFFMDSELIVNQQFQWEFSSSVVNKTINPIQITSIPISRKIQKSKTFFNNFFKYNYKFSLRHKDVTDYNEFRYCRLMIKLTTSFNEKTVFSPDFVYRLEVTTR
jgi:hypothetical protein